MSEAAAERGFWGRLVRNPFFWGGVMGIVFITAIRPFMRHIPEPPPVLGEVGRFELVNERGEPFGSEALEGEVYVVSFFFTSCPSICPPLMASMKELQEKYAMGGVDVRLVSITVDPHNDTPEVLAKYGEELGADPERWTFLTGPEEAVRSVVVDGFMTAMGAPEEGEANTVDIAHSGKLVLVDGEGRIRGYYGTDEMGLDEVYHRAKHVIREAREGE